jgi:FMN reductase
MLNVSRPLVLGMGGTPRSGSTTERALGVSLRAAAAEGAETIMIAGPDLVLPMYTSDVSERTPEGQRLVDALRRSDGIIIASPSYHGSLSGLMKNALDYVEDLRTDERVYFDGLAVGLIACAGGWQAAVQTLAALRSIVHALRGWPTPLGAALNISVKLFDEHGDCLDLSSKLQLETVGRQVVEFARMRSIVAGSEIRRPLS